MKQTAHIYAQHYFPYTESLPYLVCDNRSLFSKRRKSVNISSTKEKANDAESGRKSVIETCVQQCIFECICILSLMHRTVVMGPSGRLARTPGIDPVVLSARLSGREMATVICYRQSKGTTSKAPLQVVLQMSSIRGYRPIDHVTILLKQHMIVFVQLKKRVFCAQGA